MWKIKLPVELAQPDTENVRVLGAWKWHKVEDLPPGSYPEQNVRWFGPETSTSLPALLASLSISLQGSAASLASRDNYQG